MKKLITMSLLFAMLLTACGESRVAHSLATPTTYAASEQNPSESSQGVPWDDARCQTYLDRRDALVAVTAGLGGFTGASGLTSVIPNGMPEDRKQDLQLGLGITTVVLAATATTLVVWAKSLSERYEQRCSTQPALSQLAPMPDELMGDGGVE